MTPGPRSSVAAAMATGVSGHDARVPDSPHGDPSGGAPAEVDEDGDPRDGDPSGGAPTADVPAWLQPVLRILAETQLELATKSGDRKSRTALASLKLEEFRGGRETTTHKYRAWKKQTVITQELYGLTDAELALTIYSQVRGRAKQLLEVLEVSDLKRPDGLATVWKILDRAHEQMEHERADDAYGAWEQARRKPGQTIDEWLTYLRKTKLEVEAQDSTLVISDKQLASKMLRGAGLPYDKRAQVLFNCGGVYEPQRMETVLRVSFPRIGESERKLGLVVPRARQGLRGEVHDNRPVSKRNDDRTREGRYRDTKTVHECDDVQEYTEEDGEEDENEVFSPDDGDQEDEPEDQGEELETLAAWRAKKKTNDHRLSRGFAPKGAGKPAPTPGSPSRSAESSSSGLEARKASSRCADCKQLGHWKGDPECPKVQKGKTPKFDKDKKRPEKRPRKEHWIGMVSLTEKYTPGPSVKVLNIAKRPDADEVRVIFLTERMQRYVVDRLDRGSEIFFGSKSAGGLVKQYNLIEGKTRELFLYVIPNQADRWSAAELDVVLNQIMGPIVREMKDQWVAAGDGSGRGDNHPRAPKTEQKERSRWKDGEKAEPTRKRVCEEPDRTEIRGRERHREGQESRSRRTSREREVSPSIVEPDERQKEMLKKAVDRHGWVRRRREAKPVPREETPDGGVGRELFPEDDEEESESESEEEAEPAEENEKNPRSSVRGACRRHRLRGPRKRRSPFRLRAGV